MKNCLLLTLFFLLCCSPRKKHLQEIPTRQPNIVYILADDLGYGDVSAYYPEGKIKTPHIDRLAAEGMRFTDAHAPSSVCTPTRYGILTGRYCWRSRLPLGVLRGYGRALIEPNRTTVASLLQNQGYRTGVIGKWHLGLDWVLQEGQENALADSSTSMNEVGMVTEMNPEHLDFTKKPTDGPLNHGFDYSFVLPASLDMPPYCYLENDSLTAIPAEYTPGNDLNTGYTGAFWRPGLIAPGFVFDQVLPTFIDKALRFISDRSAENQPFFLYLPLAAPHTPWAPTPEFAGKTQAGLYGDFVAMVDEGVGKVLDRLDELGIAENTLVVFTSDNGPFWTPALIEKYQHRAAGPFRGMKADAWEGGHRIPFIVRYPGKVKPGSESAATTTLTNLLATCADVVGVQLSTDEGEDSFSIWPVLLGESTQAENQEAVIHQSSKGFFAVRQGDWKLILGRGSGGFSEPSVYEPKEGEARGQLYNLQEDAQETNDVYEQYPEIVEKLSALLDRYKKNARSR